MKGVSFSFVAETKGMIKAASNETVNPIVKMCVDKGKFRATLPENSYRVFVEKIGYKKQKVLITVANGETTNLKNEVEKTK